MARKVKMTVINDSGKVFKLKTKDPEHGKFTEVPPDFIESSGSWTCTTKNSALYGPKGTVTYETDGGKVTVAFFYNHPVGKASSSYQVTVNPLNAVGYEIRGSIEGHEQDITFFLYAVEQNS